jgi:hypothetical protein
MLRHTVLFSLFSFFFFSVSAQTLSQSVLADRLCKTWTIEKILQPGNSSGSGETASDFVLIINADHSVKQGMYPDGLINGTWTLDDENRIFTVKDNETSSVYPMKIISVTTDAMILQDQSAASSVTIYYKAK